MAGEPANGARRALYGRHIKISEYYSPDVLSFRSAMFPVVRNFPSIAALMRQL
jgi:hypothetical protein